MNFLLRSFAVGAPLTAATTFAADAFEGQVSLTVTQKNGKATDVDITMKGQLQRMDMNMGGQDASMIYDLTKREVVILMHSQHMFMVQPAPDAAKAIETKAGEPNTDIEKTGKTETILGYKCQ